MANYGGAIAPMIPASFDEDEFIPRTVPAPWVLGSLSVDASRPIGGNNTSIGGVVSVNNRTFTTDRGGRESCIGAAPKDGQMMGWDWFEKIVHKPTTIPLGAFVEAQRELYFYSTYRRSDLTLSAITLTTGAGTSITDAPSLLYTLNDQTGIPQTFLAEEDGPAIIDGNITYTFNGVDILIPVTGLRAIPMPWPAESGISEKLSWKTDILKAYSQETRRGLRDAPRRELSYSMVLERQDQEEFEVALSNQVNAFAVPCWWDQRIAGGSLITGQDLIDVDTTNSEFILGQLAMIFYSTSVFEIKEITILTDTQIGFDVGLSMDYPSAMMIPTFAGYVRRSESDIVDVDLYKARVSFSLLNHTARAATSHTQHRGIDVLTDRNVLSKKVPIRITQARHFRDNGIAGIKPFAKEDRSRVITSQNWEVQGNEQRSNLKDWLYSRYGMRKEYFKPSWQNDFIAAGDLVAVNAFFDVDSTNYEPPFDIQAELLDGSLSHHQALTKTDIGGGVDRLNLSTVTGIDALLSEIKTISMLRLQRQTKDSTTLKYTNLEMTAASVGSTDV